MKVLGNNRRSGEPTYIRKEGEMANHIRHCAPSFVPIPSKEDD